jgi:alanyl-tRNA synthetase
MIDFVGRLAVEYNHAQPPSEAEIQKIEALANQKIKENVPIEIKQMDRKLAEEYYRTHPVNETFIYDKFPVPAHITTLNILTIPEWNVNCVTGEYLKHTGEIGSELKILRLNHRPQKNELEFCFQLLPLNKQSSEAERAGKAESNTTSHPNATAPSGEGSRGGSRRDTHTEQDRGNNATLTRPLLDIVLNELELLLPPQTLTSTLREELHHRFTIKLEPLLNAMKNTAYARGFHAARHSSPIDISKLLQ